MGALAKPTYKKAQQSVKRLLIRCLPHLILIFVYLLYLVIGTVIFQAIEGHGSSQLENYMDNVSNMKKRLEAAMWNETNGVNTNWTDLLENYTSLVSMPEWKLGRLQTMQDGVAWSFPSTMLFCLITITTIGYGDIVPVTTGGKVFVGFYASFGIPLNVIFLADIGYLLAKVLICIMKAWNKWGTRKNRKEKSKKVRTVSAAPVNKMKNKKLGRLRGISGSRAMSVHGPRSVCVVDEPDKPCPRDQGSIKRGKKMTASGLPSTYGPRSVMAVSKERSKSAVVESYTKDSEESSKHNSMYPQIQDTTFIEGQKTDANGFETVALTDVEGGRLGPDRNHEKEERLTVNFENNHSTEETMEMQDVDDDHTEVPLIIVLSILIVYVLLGSLMIMAIQEPWTYGQSLYFTFITLTTIGFGDMVPTDHYDENVFFFCIIYTVVGLAVMSTCIALAQAKVLRAIDKFTAWINSYS